MFRCYEEQNLKYIKENERIDENGSVISIQKVLMSLQILFTQK